MNLYEYFYRQVLADPDATAIESPGSSDVGYAELDERSRCIAAWLAEVGADGDRVAVYMADTPSYVPVVLGAWRAGCVAVPVNTRLSRSELEFVLSDARPSVVFTDDAFADEAATVAADVDAVERTFVARTDAGFDEDAFPSPELAPEAAKKLDDDAAVVMHTSGTTGEPKGVVQTHRNVGAQVDSGIRLFDFTPADTTLGSTPLFHVGGLHGAVLMMLFSGGSVVIQRDWDPIRWAELVEETGATKAGLVPTMMVDLLESEAARARDTSSLRVFTYGGSPAPVPLLERFEAVFGVEPVSYYGQTENAGVSVTTGVDEERKPGSMGRPTPAVQAKVVDVDTGERVEPGEEGELLLRGDVVTPGYWERPERNEALFTDGWLHTEDVVREDEDGYLYYVDRLDDIVHSGGEKVPPAAVEDVLQDLDGVESVAVIGTPHERYGEAVTAVVVPDEGAELTEERVRSFCDEHDELAGYMKPRRVVFVDDFPRTGSQKVDKRALAEEVADRIDR